MGVCASDSGDGKGSAKGLRSPTRERVTIKYIRDRLGDIFDKMDSGKKGYVTQGQVTMLLMKSRRDLVTSAAKDQDKIRKEVRQMFCKARTEHDMLTEDDFVVGMTNILYPRKFTKTGLSRELVNMFGIIAQDEDAVESSMIVSSRNRAAFGSGRSTRFQRRIQQQQGGLASVSALKSV